MRVGGIGPEARCIPVVGVPDIGRQLADPFRHGGWEAVDRRRTLGRSLERTLVNAGVVRRVDAAESIEQHLRSGERLLHGNLLVEREADEQRHRVGGEQPIGVVVSGEVEVVDALDGHAIDRTPPLHAPRSKANGYEKGLVTIKNTSAATTTPKTAPTPKRTGIRRASRPKAAPAGRMAAASRLRAMR